MPDVEPTNEGVWYIRFDMQRNAVFFKNLPLHI